MEGESEISPSVVKSPDFRYLSSLSLHILIILYSFQKIPINRLKIVGFSTHGERVSS